VPRPRLVQPGSSGIFGAEASIVFENRDSFQTAKLPARVAERLANLPRQILDFQQQA